MLYKQERDSPSKSICPKLIFQARLFSVADVLSAYSSHFFWFLFIQSGKSVLVKYTRLAIRSAKKVLRIPCFINKRGIRLPNQFVLNWFFRRACSLSQTSCLLILPTRSAFAELRIPCYTSKRGIRLPNQFVLNWFFRRACSLSQTSCLLFFPIRSAFA